MKNRLRQRGFTLVELLVVIGIIAVLISILLPGLNAARRAADRTKCLAAMRQMGSAYQLYAVDNKGAWPVARHTWTSPVATPPNPQGVTRPAGARDKRWYDYIGKYLVGNVVGGREINFEGTQVASYEPQLWTPAIKDGNNPLWGCPSWRRSTTVGTTTSTDPALNYHTGYAMNFYALAPLDLTATGATDVTKRALATHISGGTTAKNSVYFKQSQWKNPAERALVVESVHGNLAVSNLSTPWNWPYKPENPSGVDLPAVPDGGVFSVDYNRHGKRNIGNGPNDASLNMLYADGHAASVSAREAWRAIRFK